MSLAGRLYRGDTDIDFVGRRRVWFAISALLLLVSIGSIVFRGFQFGIEFQGGNTFQIPASSTTLTRFEAAVRATGTQVATAQQAGAGSQQTLVIKTPELPQAKSNQVKQSIAKQLGIPESSITDSHVSSSWGSDVSLKALRGLLAFLVLVCVYIAIRFEYKMAIAAIAALFHDLLLSAGIYSLVGFEVTPSTVVGLLTILGFSLYDTVVVFDKVAENSRGLLGGSRMTYSEAANLAVNQTLMRSINTSLIALLPVAGLLFVGAGLLGVGTLKDLALVLFVGLATGAYSSLFLATPILAMLKERERPYAALRLRVAARRSPDARPASAGRRAAQDEPAADESVDGANANGTEAGQVVGAGARRGAGTPAPRPGSRPDSARRRGGRPGAKRKRR